MFDQLTSVDIKKLKDELEYRIGTVRPKILEEVKFTRSFGDLSENADTTPPSVNAVKMKAV